MELPYKPKVPALSNGDRIIKAPTDDKRYNKWEEDDAARDPTPANKRRVEILKQTFPKPGKGVSRKG